MARKKRSTSASKRSKKHSAKSDAHAGEHPYEFGGPVGAIGVPMLLICTIYSLVWISSPSYALTPSNCSEILEHLPSSFDEFKREVFSVEACGVFVGWFAFQVLLAVLLPGDVAEGTKLRDGATLKYTLNAHLAFWVSLGVLAHGMPKFDASGRLIGLTNFPLSWCYDNYLKLATASMLFSFVLSVYLYLKSFKKNAMLAAGGDMPSKVYNWFIGRELNPRELGFFDWKEFCELRPGLIGWCVVNLGCLQKQYELTGSVSTNMLLINVFHLWYVWDGLFQERAILTTMDITTDGFGFMLAFGDLAWVPFTYSIQARFLVENDPGTGMNFAIAVFCLQCVGYSIFRGANGEKDRFRRDPNDPSVSHLEFIETESGRKLLVSGWWGVARKINYTGDWLMGLAWSLTTGFVTPVTYFYSLYFLILLIHRAWRDDEACATKYGDDWPRYKAKVPYVFLPGVI